MHGNVDVIERQRQPAVGSAPVRHAVATPEPRLIVATTTPDAAETITRADVTAPIEHHSEDLGAPARSAKVGPASIDIPPAAVPASLASTTAPFTSLDAHAPTLASAVPTRDEIDTPSASTPAVPRVDTPALVASSTTASAVVPASDVASVREALSRYGSAYSRLDAGAARAVWPSVDARALGRAFAELRSQRVTFENCDIAVNGTRARAACRGAATWVARAGDQSPRTEARAWRFELEKGRDANWQIASANISVPRESTRAR